MLHVVDAEGRYIGSYRGDVIPESVAQKNPGAVAVPSPPPHSEAIWNGTQWDMTPALPALRAEADKQLVEMLDAAASRITAGYPEGERASWPTKQREAEALLADATAPAPTIRAEAAARSIDPLVLAKTIVDRATQLATLAGALAGIRGKTQAAITAATTPEEIDAALAAARDEIAALGV